MSAVIEHLIMLDHMAMIDHVVEERSYSPRPHWHAINRLRSSGKLNPSYDGDVIKIVEEFKRTGTSTEAEERRARWARCSPWRFGALSMCAIKGVGPKRAWLLASDGYPDLDALVLAAKAGKLDKRGQLATAVLRAHKYGPYATMTEATLVVI